jgi:hypothetical protein
MVFVFFSLYIHSSLSVTAPVNAFDCCSSITAIGYVFSTQCDQKNVVYAYHILCQDCAQKKKVCAKCGEEKTITVDERVVAMSQVRFLVFLYMCWAVVTTFS